MLPYIAYGLTSAMGIWVGRKVFRPQKTHPNIGIKSKSRARKRPQFELLREYVLEDDAVILATEDVPLDNRFGNRVLVSELEFSRTATVSLNIGEQKGMGSSFNTNFFQMMQSWTSMHVSKSLGTQVGSQISRMIRLRLSCDPGKVAMYRVVWKQESRRGILETRVGNRIIDIPSTATYGLSHSLESLDHLVESPPHFTGSDHGDLNNES